MTNTELNKGTNYLLKMAGPFSELGIGENSQTKIKGLAKPPNDREGMKLNPYLVGGLNALAPIGALANLGYAGGKDIANAKYTGLDRINEIDPGKFSWDRANYMEDRSATSHVSGSSAKKGLMGFLGGAGAGALGSMAHSGMTGADDQTARMNLVMSSLLGAAGGGLGGLVYGGYRGAKNYNEKVIDKLGSADEILNYLEANPEALNAVRGGLSGAVGGGMMGYHMSPDNKFKHTLTGIAGGGALGAGAGYGVTAGMEGAANMYHRHQLGKTLEDLSHGKAKDLMQNMDLTMTPKK